MSITFVAEITDGRRAEQDFGGPAKAPRVFTVTVDTPSEPLVNIANACGIQWLDPHPEFPTYCVGISPENDGDPLTYKVTFRYDLLKPQDRFLLPWQRQDKFSYDGGLTSGPAFLQYNDAGDTPPGGGNDAPRIITNSAGDPLEGLMRDEAEWTIQIEGNRQTFNKALARQYLNAVNSDGYSGCEAGTLKCQRISGTQEIEQIQGEDVSYWKVNVTLAYREVGWPIRTWDVGYNEIVRDRQNKRRRRRIVDMANQPVSQPVALRNGERMEEDTLFASGPDILKFRVYKKFPFTGVFPPLP